MALAFDTPCTADGFLCAHSYDCTQDSSITTPEALAACFAADPVNDCSTREECEAIAADAEEADPGSGPLTLHDCLIDSIDCIEAACDRSVQTCFAAAATAAENTNYDAIVIYNSCIATAEDAYTTCLETHDADYCNARLEQASCHCDHDYGGNHFVPPASPDLDNIDCIIAELNRTAADDGRDARPKKLCSAQELRAQKTCYEEWKSASVDLGPPVWCDCSIIEDVDDRATCFANANRTWRMAAAALLNDFSDCMSLVCNDQRKPFEDDADDFDAALQECQQAVRTCLAACYLDDVPCQTSCVDDHDDCVSTLPRHGCIVCAYEYNLILLDDFTPYPPSAGGFAPVLPE